jgi:hypothetical protein
MKKRNRREFLGHMIKGGVVGLLGILPGSLFNREQAFASAQSKDSLESVLKRVTKSNLYRELNVAKLSQEEKVAIAAVKEIPRDTLKETITRVQSGKESICANGGFGCGNGCGGECGCLCGLDCSMPTKIIDIVDQKGDLKIKTNTIDKSRLLNTLEKALELIK